MHSQNTRTAAEIPIAQSDLFCIFAYIWFGKSKNGIFLPTNGPIRILLNTHNSKSPKNLFHESLLNFKEDQVRACL